MTSMIYPTTNPAMSETMVVARAEGPYIYDKQGKRYLEGMAGLWCTALGYGCLLYTSPSPRDAHESRMPSSA